MVPKEAQASDIIVLISGAQKEFGDGASEETRRRNETGRMERNHRFSERSVILFCCKQPPKRRSKGCKRTTYINVTVQNMLSYFVLLKNPAACPVSMGIRFSKQLRTGCAACVCRLVLVGAEHRNENTCQTPTRQRHGHAQKATRSHVES